MDRSGDAKWLYVAGVAGDNSTFAITWQGGQTLALAQNGLAALPGAQRLRETSVAPGPFGGRYAFTRRAEQSNLFRIRLP